MARTASILPIALGAALVVSVSACGSCKKTDAETPPPTSSAPIPSSEPVKGAVAEVLPRCRPDAARLALPGDDVVVGDVAISPSGLLVGLVRTEPKSGKRLASVLRASPDLSSSRVVDLGPAFGDDPPPSPRVHGATAYVLYLERQASDAGPPEGRGAPPGSRIARLRSLRVARLDDADVPHLEASLVQQADESTAFDVAWSGESAVVAWDEDAPPRADAGATIIEGRGFVKVQVLGDQGRPRVASPETSDAESPQLLARPGGYWLAWLARRAEEEAYGIEGPGESRAFRWVEAIALDARGEAQGPVRRVSSEKGRATSFELASSGSDLVVMIQDEAAGAEGAGARIVRHVLMGLAPQPPAVQSSDVVDSGVGHALAEVVPTFGATPSGSPELPRWLAWSDTAEHTHVAPLRFSGLAPLGPSTLEPSLDGSRLLAEVRGAGSNGLFALTTARTEAEGGERSAASRPEIRRFLCQ